MAGRFAAGAELAGRGHNSAAHMMLPQAVHDHAREQVARTIMGIGYPIRECPAAVGSPPTFCGRNPPVFLSVWSGCQHLQESLAGNTVLLVGIAASQKVTSLEVIRPL